MSVVINSTNFPDDEFREYVSTKYDQDSDGILSDDEISAAKTMALRRYVTNIGYTFWLGSSVAGIEYLTALEDIEIQANLITSIDISHAPNLEKLNLHYCYGLTSLNVSGNSKLKILNITCTNISTIDLSSNPLLEELCINWYTTPSWTEQQQSNVVNIHQLDLSHNPALKKLDATTYYGSNKTLTLSSLQANPLLEEIYVSGAEITSLDAHSLTHLVTVRFGAPNQTYTNFPLRSVNFNGCTALTNLGSFAFILCPNIEEVDLGGCVSLTGTISCYNRKKITRFNVAGCSNIENIVIHRQYVQTKAYDPSYSDGITVLDVTGCRNIEGIGCSYNAIEQIIFDDLPYEKLLSISCYRNRLQSLILPDTPKLYQLYCQINNFTSLNLTKAPTLVSKIANCTKVTVKDADSNEQEWHYYYNYLQKRYSEQTNGYYEDSYLKCDTTVDVNDGTIRITDDIEDVIVNEGSNATFTIAASGDYLTYRWNFYDPTDGAWTILNGETGSTLTFSNVTSALDGAMVQCSVTNGDKTTESSIATITVLTAPTITSHPQSATVTEGQTVLFSVVADGNDVRYQWQSSSNNGSTWTDISGAVSANYSVRTTLSMNGNKYRCRATNAVGDVVSNAATLTVEEDTRITPPTITTHPTSQSVNDGDTVMFTAAASGTNLSYQWQVIQDGTTHTWVSISGATGTTYSISATSALNGKKYRCAVTNEAGTVYSNAATLTVTAQPSPTPTPTPTPSRITNATRIIINGVDITRFIRFQGLKWSRNDVDGPNAGRNMIGDMIRDRVATKIRIDISCRPLTSDEHQMLMNLIMPEFVTVMYNDPVYGFTSKTMYANNNNSEYCICKSDGREYWHNVTFPLIEK